MVCGPLRISHLLKPLAKLAFVHCVRIQRITLFLNHGVFGKRLMSFNETVCAYKEVSNSGKSVLGHNSWDMFLYCVGNNEK